MRDRVADLVSVVDIELSLMTTEYSPNYAGTHLLVTHEVLLTKPSILQSQKAFYVACFDVDDFRFVFCGSSLPSQISVRSLFSVLKRVPQVERHFWSAKASRWEDGLVVSLPCFEILGLVEGNA